MEKELHREEHPEQQGLAIERHLLELEAEWHACTRRAERRLIGREIRHVRAAIAALAEGEESV